MYSITKYIIKNQGKLDGDPFVRLNCLDLTASNPEPEPGTMMLFCISLLDLAGVSRKKIGSKKGVYWEVLVEKSETDLKK